MSASRVKNQYRHVAGRFSISPSSVSGDSSVFLTATSWMALLLVGCGDGAESELIVPPLSPPPIDSTLFPEVAVRIAGHTVVAPSLLTTETTYPIEARFRVAVCDRAPRVQMLFMRKHGEGEKRTQGGIALTQAAGGRAWFRDKIRTPRRPGRYELRLIVLPKDLEGCREATTGVIYSTIVDVTPAGFNVRSRVHESV